jgi:hypothetical protein
MASPAMMMLNNYVILRIPCENKNLEIFSNITLFFFENTYSLKNVFKIISIFLKII